MKIVSFWFMVTHTKNRVLMCIESNIFAQMKDFHDFYI